MILDRSNIEFITYKYWTLSLLFKQGINDQILIKIGTVMLIFVNPWQVILFHTFLIRLCKGLQIIS